MKRLWLIILAATLAALMLCGAALAEEGVEATGAVDAAVGEIGEADLFAPEVYADEAPEFQLGDGVAEPESAPADAPNAVDNALYIKIDSVHFPDPAFRQYVLDNLDPNGDGWLTEAERRQADEIYAPSEGIGSLQGIEYFGELTLIICGHNDIEALDVSNNPKLVNLRVNNNKLTEVDVGENAKLELLDVSGNLLDELDVSKNAKLKTLYTENNDIVHLDINKNPTLQGWVKNGKVVEGNVVNWGASSSDGFVVRLSIDATTRLTAGSKVLYAPRVVEINAEHFPAEDFRKYVLDACDTDRDGWLDGSEIVAVTNITLRSANDYYRGVGQKNCPTLKGIEYFTFLKQLTCPGCGIEELNLEQNEALEMLDCFANNLFQLDVSENDALKRIWCFDNRLTSLDLSDNPALESLSCGNNAMTSLYVSENPALESLYCSNNRLTKLDVRWNPALVNLECADNELENLDVRKNTRLETLDCGSNDLSALNVTKNTKLKSLRCGENGIKTLNVKKCPNLKLLYCDDNKLTALTLTVNRNLVQLDCSDNAIKKLNLSKNTKLTELWCQGNRLKKVDIAKCAQLVKLVKNVKMRTDDDTVYWQKTEGKYVMGISRSTTLTNGKKVLYRGN